MKRFLALLLTICLTVSTALAETISTPTDLEPIAPPTAEPTQAPTETPSAEPTQTPDETPTEEPTQEPAPTTDAPTQASQATDEPIATPEATPPATATEPSPTDAPNPTQALTEEPTSVPTGEVTAQPSEATAEPTQAPTETPSAEPTAEPTPEPTATTSPADGPLYVLVDGVKVYGQPETLIPLELVIYLYDDTVVEISGYTADELSAVKFALDPEVFTAEDDCIYLSVRDPNGFVKQDTFFLWAGKKGDMSTATPVPPTNDEIIEHEILVTAQDYTPDAPCFPTFLLTAAPALAEGMTFAVMVDEGDPQLLSGDRYSPQVSGSYRFALLSADGTVLHRSSKFTVVIPEPTPEPTAEPTPEPTEEPTPEPTAEPTPEPTAEPTQVPTEEPTAEPTPVPTEAPTAEPVAALPAAPEASAQAWATVGDMYIEGDLAELLQSDGQTIYILTERIIVLDGGNVQLSGKTLLPDPNVFGDGYVVRISGENEEVERSDSLFVWVEAKGSSSVTAVSLQVETDAYASDAWASVVPSFILTATPSLSELGDGYAFAVSVDGGAPIILTDSVYPAMEEGQYTLQFSLLGPDGTALAQSPSYPVLLDVTPPLMQIKAANTGALQITVGDALSGGDALSLDGGVTWQALSVNADGIGSYTHTVTETTTFPMGSLMVRDKAGCITFYPEEVSLRIMTMSGGFRGGSGSGRTTSHSASTEESVTAYDGVELILDEGSMSQLTFGDETLDLTLSYTGEEVMDEDHAPSFTAQFSDLTGDSVLDALTLFATDVTTEQAADYTWTFSGQVAKKLSASGIDYLLLRAGDQLTVLSTSGFTAGLRYNMYRAEGMVSKDFLYTLRMDADHGLDMHITVADTTYAVSDDPSAEFYYYDLFSGDMETWEWALRMYGKLR